MVSRRSGSHESRLTPLSEFAIGLSKIDVAELPPVVRQSMPAAGVLVLCPLVFNYFGYTVNDSRHPYFSRLSVKYFPSAYCTHTDYTKPETCCLPYVQSGFTRLNS